MVCHCFDLKFDQKRFGIILYFKLTFYTIFLLIFFITCLSFSMHVLIYFLVLHYSQIPAINNITCDGVSKKKYVTCDSSAEDENVSELRFASCVIQHVTIMTSPQYCDDCCCLPGKLLLRCGARGLNGFAGRKSFHGGPIVFVCLRTRKSCCGPAQVCFTTLVRHRKNAYCVFTLV